MTAVSTSVTMKVLVNTGNMSGHIIPGENGGTAMMAIKNIQTIMRSGVKNGDTNGHFIRDGVNTVTVGDTNGTRPKNNASMENVVPGSKQFLSTARTGQARARLSA